MAVQTNGRVEMARDRREAAQFTTGRGVVLQLSKVNALLINQRMQQNHPPRPPMVWIEEKQREEENPNHPEYLAALNKFNEDQGYLACDLYVMLGTKLINLPDGVWPPESDEWMKLYEEVGIELDVPAAGLKRYGAWVKWYACEDHNEYLAIMNRIQSMSGMVTEQAAEAAEGTFRGDETQDSDSGVPTDVEVPERNRPGVSRRIRTRTGDAGGGEVRGLHVDGVALP